VEYSYLAPLMILLTVHLMLNLAVLPLFSINMAYNKVRVPGIVSLIMGVGNFALAMVLSLFSGWGYYGVAVAGAIVLTFKNAIFTPWYATRVMGIGAHTFTKAIFPGILAGFLVIGLAFSLNFILALSKLIPLLITSGILSCLYIFLMWRIGLSKSERNLFGSYLPVKLKRFMLEII